MSHVDNVDLEQKKRQQKLEILVQQAENLVTRSGGGVQSTDVGVPYSKLYSLANRNEKCLMVVGWVFSGLAGLGMPSFVFFMGEILDAYDPTISSDEMEDTINKTCLSMVMIGVYLAITNYFYFGTLLYFSEKVSNKMRIQYLKAILQQESKWYDLTSPQELSSRLRKEIVAISQALGEKMGTIIMSFCMCISGFVFAFTKGWSYSFVLLAMFPPMLISTQMLTSVMQGSFTQNMKAYGQSAGYAEQALNAIRVVVAFGQEERESTVYNRYLTNAKTSGIMTTFKTSLILAFFMFISLVSYAYSFFMGSVWIYNEIENTAFDRLYTAGDILTCFFGVLFGMYALGMAAPNIKAVSVGKVAGKMVFDIIDRVPDIPIDDPSSKAHTVGGDIEFKNVTFVYPSRPDQQILSNFNFHFQKGKTTAIVGPSGSGKSTIVQLLERFYDPKEGQVLIDGQDLKAINLKNYRQQIGYVGQEPILFNTTLRKNILFGKPDANEEEIRDALTKANAIGFLEDKENWLDMHVGQSGGQLSGGQKQRIAIARAFIKKPKVLIFDEATSALDTKNEKEVQKAIDEIKEKLGQVTTIVIAHRLTTIQHADSIVVLKKGNIVEQGTHKELLQKGGTYAKLIKMQENQNADSSNESPSSPSPGKKTEKNGYNTNDPMLNSSAEVQAVEGKDRHNAGGYDFSAQKRVDRSPMMDDQDPQEKVVEMLNEEGPIESDRIPIMGKQVSRKKSEHHKHHHHELHEQEKKMKEEIDKKDDEEAEVDKLEFQQIEKTSFFKRLNPYSKPVINVVIGIVLSMVNGGVFPVFGVLMTKTLFAMMLPDLETMKEDTWGWSLYMFIISLVSLMGTFLVRFLFGIVGENITLSIREKMYFQVLKKSIAWFDLKENAPGVITQVLANDASQLSGASTEGLGIMLESMLGIVVALVLSFFYSWHLTLVALGCVPIMFMGGVANARFQAGFSNHDEVAYKEADLLSGDSILNQRTVTSFGHDEIVIQQYEEYLEGPHKKALKSAHLIGFLFGLNQLVQFCIFGFLFWVGTQFIIKLEGDVKQEDIMMATFIMMFGAFGAGQSNQYGPDVGKAKKAAVKIFRYIDKPSKINAVDIGPQALPVPDNLRGEIEFRDVWFRYPTRRNEWVFKGLNLRLRPDESVAIVGESGCGKSTLVNLVLRFYDPCAGEVLIDGVNIKDYNLKELREKMGLVMQEPTLFNYTVKENILYGRKGASDSAIREAAETANALEFIESQELFDAVEDSAPAILEAFQARENELTELLGEKDYKLKIDQLMFIEKKERKEGRFKAEKGITDDRASELRGELHEGFEIDCGLRGGKLSGGQKQRIAIARAVIRKPQILILDEATSALDEDSQKKVQKALEAVMDNRTSIVIAHRLSTVEKCKRIVVLENGRVVEDGSVNELKSNSEGHFAKLQQNMKKQEKHEQKQSRKFSRVSERGL